MNRSWSRLLVCGMKNIFAVCWFGFGWTAVAADVPPSADPAFLWEFATGKSLPGNPVAYDGKLYVSGRHQQNGAVFELDLATGKLERIDPLPSRGGFPFSAFSSPVIWQGMLLHAWDCLQARNLSDGKELWLFRDMKRTYDTPKVAGEAVFFATIDRVYSLTAEGSMRWSAPLAADSAARSACDGTHFYVGDQQGNFYAFRLADGHEAWRLTRPKAIRAKPVVTGKLVIFGDFAGTVSAVSAATGQPVWNFHCGGMIFGDPAADATTIYVPSGDGCIYALALTDGKLRWKTRLPSWVSGSLCVRDGMVAGGDYAGNGVLLSATDGRILATRRFGDWLRAAPVMTGGMVIFTGMDGTVRTFDRAKLLASPTVPMPPEKPSAPGPSAPEEERFDAVILGTGPSALAAAEVLTAAGKKAVVVGDYGITGGALTADLQLRMRPPAADAPAGIRAMYEFMRTADPRHRTVSENFAHPEWLKHAVEEGFRKLGVPVRLHTLPFALVRGPEGGIGGVRVWNKSGLGALTAPLVFDCTDNLISQSLLGLRRGVEPVAACFRMRLDDVENRRAMTEKFSFETRDFSVCVAPIDWADSEVLVELSGRQRLDLDDPLALTALEVEFRSAMAALLRDWKRTRPEFRHAVPLQSSLAVEVVPEQAVKQTPPPGLYWIGDSRDSADFHVADAVRAATGAAKQPAVAAVGAGTPPEDAFLPELAHAEIVVVGGGTAGLSAALQAAVAGKDVLLIEYYGFFGGAAVAGGVAQGGKPELLKLLYDQGYCAHPGWGAFVPEAMKSLLLDLTRKAGVRLLLNTAGTGVVMKGRRIQSIVVQNRNGRRFTVGGRIFIDATGDGDIAAAAGVPYQIGARGTGSPQPVETMYYWRPDRPRPGEVGQHGGAGIYEALAIDETALSRAEIAGRTQLRRPGRIIGREGMRLIASAPQVGVRETRRMEGDYELGVYDLFARTEFPDRIMECNYMIDIQGDYFEPALPFQLPYRILLPKKVDNLLLAGRHVSVSHEVMGAIRLQHTLNALGRIAGMAAVLALDAGNDPRKIDVKRLQQMADGPVEIYRKLCDRPEIRISDAAPGAKNLLDGDVNSWWVSEDRPEGGHWIEVRLAAPRRCQMIEIVTRSGSHALAEDHHIRCAGEDGRWNDLKAEAEVREHHGWKVYTYRFPETALQSFRLAIPEKNRIVEISELRFR